MLGRGAVGGSPVEYKIFSKISALFPLDVSSKKGLQTLSNSFLGEQGREGDTKFPSAEKSPL